MKVTEVSVSRGVTVNLGNYESGRFDVSYRGTVEAKDKPEKVVDILLSACKAELRKMIAASGVDLTEKAALDLGIGE